MLPANPYTFVHRFWEFILVVTGIRQQVWCANPYDNGPDSKWDKTLINFWVDNGYMKFVEQAGFAGFELTPDGAKLILMKDLFEYELEMFEHHKKGISATDPAMYELLRRALVTYTNQYLKKFHTYIKKNVTERLGKQTIVPITILDVGCGKAPYTQPFQNVSGVNLVYVDKNRLEQQSDNIMYFFLDFTKLPMDFAMRFQRGFDLIVCSEFLHCLSLHDANRAIMNMHSLLAPGGEILLIEQFPSWHLKWRLELKTNGGGFRNYKTLFNNKQLFRQTILLDGFQGDDSPTHYLEVFGRQENT